MQVHYGVTFGACIAMNTTSNLAFEMVNPLGTSKGLVVEQCEDHASSDFGN